MDMFGKTWLNNEHTRSTSDIHFSRGVSKLSSANLTFNMRRYRSCVRYAQSCAPQNENEPALINDIPPLEENEPDHGVEEEEEELEDDADVNIFFEEEVSGDALWGEREIELLSCVRSCELSELLSE